MSNGSGSETRWGRVVAIILGVGLLILIPMILIARSMIHSAERRARIAANEAAAIDTIDLIGAAERLHHDTFGQYVPLPQLIESGILNIKFTGDPPAYKGYAFIVKVIPGTEGQAPGYSIQADPTRSDGKDATGQRHFYIDSKITGMRYNEERPATPNDKVLPRAEQF